MRSSLFIILSLVIFTPLAHANDGGLVMPVTAPWAEESYAPQDIVPKKISLADLEQLDRKPVKKEKTSSLEDLYSSRIIDELEQYGYDLFSDDARVVDNQIPAGTVQDGYILSAGDTLNVILRGQMNTRRDYVINNQGLLIIEDLPPITAAGRSLKSVQADLQNEIQNLHNTQIFVSLSGVRQIGILVVGHVKQPGARTSPLSTPR